MIDLAQYSTTVCAFGAMGVLMLLQVLVADVVGIKRRHPPGAPIQTGPDDLLFRVSRTVANTNESVAIFIVFIVFGMWSGAAAGPFGAVAWSYVVCRALYAMCYYLGLSLMRSVCFGLSLVALLGLLVIAAL